MSEPDHQFSSAGYWEYRYGSGGSSGAGSYGRLALYKAAFLNDFFKRNKVRSAIEFGCGDGNQAALLKIADYTGIDVSQSAIDACRARKLPKAKYRFHTYEDLPAGNLREAALSIDVIFHLVEDEVFARYVAALFSAATRYVVVYSSNFDAPWPAAHVKHRRFTDHVARAHPDWALCATAANIFPYDGSDVDNTSFCDFFVFRLGDSSCVVSNPTVGSIPSPAPSPSSSSSGEDS